MARRLIGVVVLLLAVAACGGDPKADPPPAPSTSPVSTTPSASPTVPALPREAAAYTKAGAIAFVRYYVGLINHLQQTGEHSALQMASLRTCRSCKAVVRAAKAIYDVGGHVEGGEWSIVDTTASRPTTTLWEVRVEGRLAASRVINGPRSVPPVGKGGDANAEFFLTFDQGWKVAQWHTG